MKKTTYMLAAVVAMSATGATAATNLVQNGDFEDLGGQSLNHGNWGTFETIPGWSDQGGNDFEIQTNATVGQIDSHNGGNNYVELDAHNPFKTSNSQIGQMVNLAAGNYELTFYYSPRVKNNTSGTTNDMYYSVGTLADTVLAGVIEGAPNAAYPYKTWTEVSAIFTVATAGSYNLVFGGSGQQDTLGGFIDDVSISAVPLPAGMLLMLGGLGGLAAMRRRKGKK